MEKELMTESSLIPLSFPMPEIPGVTVTHGGLHYLQPELLLDFISVSAQPLASVTPVAVLYADYGKPPSRSSFSLRNCIVLWRCIWLSIKADFYLLPSYF